jgi:rod shape-determining protein MreD
MTTLLLIAYGFLLLVLETAVATLVPMHGFAPNLMLPIAIYLGVSGDVYIVRGAFTCFVLGYLLDSFCGNPMGLQTFVLTASFMVARGAGTRFFPQSPTFQVLLTFLTATAYGATVLALRAIFEQPSLSLFGEATEDTLTSLTYSAATTALVSPLVLAGQTLGAQKRDERTVSS